MAEFSDERSGAYCMCTRDSCSDECKTYRRFHPKPKTNADRIRAMTDEELAKYLDGVCHDLWQMFVKDPQKMWLDWLREEVTDG